jgi:deoxyribodipyrimidine photo-lyase
MPSSSIVWFRDDLRLADNPALTEAAASGGPVIAVYVHDVESEGMRAPGGASLWWLHHSLTALGDSLRAHGVPLLIFREPAREAVLRCVTETGATAVHWNRRYGAAEIAVDTAVKGDLKAAGIDASSHNASLLYEPWKVRSKVGDPFKVFSPFWRAAMATGEPPPPRPAPSSIKGAELPAVSGAVRLEDLDLLPTKPDWAGGFRETWRPGEAGAAEALDLFLEEGLHLYAGNRDRPDMPATSSLSPRLRFGEIGPRQVWHAAAHALHDGRIRATEKDLAKFHTELGWREFSYHLLFHNPDLARTNFQRRFDAFPWRDDRKSLRLWQRGLTGVPIVDAGMRQLWRTGWMHNRVRMIVASFLVKDLLIDWRAGEEFFWDTLVDADPANNAASWQWVAGSGADAAPYFRVFNPITQGEKFDPDGIYVRRWVPELAGLPNAVVHRPWEASPAVLAEAGVRLGETYPGPMVDHGRARDRALAALASLKPDGSGSRISSDTAD